MADAPIKVTSKTITVAGRKLTVWKATFAASLTRFTKMEEAQKTLNGLSPSDENEGLENLVRRGFHLNTYPSLVACTTGKVFTEAECYQIENDDLDAWLAAARELNPTWFPAVTAETPQETIEKKES